MSTDMRLTRLQRNSVFERVIKKGLNPAEFKFDESHNLHFRYSVLRHGPSEGYFTFGVGLDQYRETYFPTAWAPGTEEQTERIDLIGREYQIDRVDEWLDALVANISAPDLWEQYRSAMESIFERSDDPTPLLDVDRRMIDEQLAAAIESLEERQTSTSEELAELRREMDLLRKEMRRSGTWGDIKKHVIHELARMLFTHGPTMAQAFAKLLSPIFGADAPQLPEVLDT
ncbi:MAG: hypothetical protein U0900_02170 [Myxococcota bacterium]